MLKSYQMMIARLGDMLLVGHVDEHPAMGKRGMGAGPAGICGNPAKWGIGNIYCIRCGHHELRRV